VPIYEYRCEACGHQEEHLQKVSDTPLDKCPACGKPSYRKLLSAAGFQLKGSGWYATDFKAGARKAESKTSESKSESKSESTGESKSETKTSETKSEPKPDAAKPKAA
jgi:putative FmdB family regulatory protein